MPRSFAPGAPTRRVVSSKTLGRGYANDVGALLASILFPILFVPRLGLVRTSLVFGMLNAAVALWGTWLLRPLIKGSIVGLRVKAAIVMQKADVTLPQALKRLRKSEDSIRDALGEDIEARLREVLTGGL